MATMLETPSRIWRRIEAIEDQDMPSLPSLPPFEDSAEEGPTPSEVIQQDYDDQFEESLENISSPMHSTPAASSHHTAASTIRAPLTSSSTSRFANSIASRSVKSIGITSVHDRSTRTSRKDSFDISDIPSFPVHGAERGAVHDNDVEGSQSSVPEVYLPPEDEDGGSGGEREYSLTDALQSISRSNSPSPPPTSKVNTPKRGYDYSISLKSEPKASPFDKYRNVAMRRTIARTRTPSLSRTTNSSQTSSPAASTPQSNKSISLAWSDAGSPISSTTMPLPPLAAGSPPRDVHPEGEVAGQEEHNESQETHESDVRSMDITDLHISPQRIDGNEGEHQSTTGNPSPIEPSLEAREPTFSSEGDSTPYSPQNRTIGQYSRPSPGGISNALSSPAPSLAFTPTPAFPRPRARFSLPKPPSDLLATPAPKEVSDEQDDDLVTPHTRRRSFLLSVINSTARPRLKFPTPHPRHLPDTSSITELTPGPNSGGASSGSAVNLQSAFAGVTPRPRIPAGRRMSHPLAQTVAASPGTSESESGEGPTLRPWATPAQSSPYDGAGDRASFISTASSHDLTTHHRVNTSFDPSMGFGSAAQGHGVGRFNAGKLNNYLHGLNRRLQEENEILLARLRKIEEGKDQKGEPDTGRRLSGGNRRVSAGGTLGNVQEDVAEGWLEEKAELEEMVDAFKEEVAKCMEEKEEIEKELEKEREDRERDKDRWKERMAEVEEGVAGIVTGLEQKLEAAEKRVDKSDQRADERIREMKKKLSETSEELDFAMERASKAERVLESGRDLGPALNEANERIAQVMGDLRNANSQMKELEEEVMRSDSRIDELEKELRDDKDVIAGLEDELNTQSDAIAAERAKASQQDLAIRQLEEELHATREYVNELEEGATIAVEQVDKLEKDLNSAEQMIQNLTAQGEQSANTIQGLEDEARRAQDVARQMEEAMEEAEKKMRADEDTLGDLKSKVASLERERTKLKQAADAAAQEPSYRPAETGLTEADLEALEHELDDANKEIARLNTLLSQSPARKAIEKAKDAKIEMLEREKEDLLERNKALRMTFNEMATPSKVVNASGISPIHRHVLSMSIRAPRTPGGPLRDMSWLNSTVNDPSVSPLIAEINRLQHELDIANDSIDDKLDKLEDAGLGVVGLTKKLEDARSKIGRLEDEIGRLSRKEERYMRRLARTRCKKCNIKLDLRRLAQADESTIDISRDNLPSEPPTPPTRTTEVLRADLQSINSHLDNLKKKWEQEKKQLVGEKAALQDAANRLNKQVKNVKEDVKKVSETGRVGEKVKANTQHELDRAKRTISELESALSDERSRLRSLTTEQDRVQGEKKRVLADLQRTESDMEDVKQQLQRFKQENQELEMELRHNATAEQKARLLENKVAENADTISHLRQERSLLASDHKDLQRRYSELSETVNKLREEHAAHSTSHDNWRHQLDLQLLEIEDLRQALQVRTGDLQKVEQEKDRVASEKNDVARTVAALETDLRRVRRDAEAFGRDLKSLRMEKDKAEARLKEEIAKGERAKKQTQTQVRLLNEQFDAQKEKTSRAREEFKAHVCVADDTQISTMKLQHNKECKGLMVQIRYLKAKFTRESSFRLDLVYQKKYFLVLLSQFEKSERTIFASIARIGFPTTPTPPTRRPRKLKSVATMIVFLARIKRSSGAWKEQSEAKSAITAALEEVRRKRALVP